jgi:hypothetical protein
MNKIVLIGNGFDLAHGRKTKYSDFVLWYFKKVNQISEDHRSNHSDGLIRINFNGRYLENSVFKSVNHVIQALRTKHIEFIYANPFFESIVETARNFNWVDIEAMYYSSLITLYKKLEKLQTNGNPSVQLELTKLNNCLAAIERELTIYLSEITQETCEKNQMIEQYFHRLIRARDFDQKTDQLLLINFNYTSTIDLYFDKPTPFIKIINIHGRLNDPGNPIIFGYGDEMDMYYEKLERLNNNEFLRCFKSFSYFYTTNYQNITGFLENKPFRVAIMGHSCGLSDRVLLNGIFEHPNCQRIKVFYHRRSDNTNDYFQKTQEISRHFNPGKKNEMRNKIVPFPESIPLS